MGGPYTWLLTPNDMGTTHLAKAAGGSGHLQLSLSSPMSPGHLTLTSAPSITSFRTDMKALYIVCPVSIFSYIIWNIDG